MNVLQLSGSVTKAVGLGIGDSTKGRLKPARTADPIVKEPPSEAHRSDPLTPVSHGVCTSVKSDYSRILIGRERGRPSPKGQTKAPPNDQPSIGWRRRDRRESRQGGTHGGIRGQEGQIATGVGVGKGECLPTPPKPKPHKAHSPILSGSLLRALYGAPLCLAPYRGVLAS